MTHPYRDAIFLIERLHRHFLEVVKAELDRTGVEDINNVQALILFNIGEEELTVGELTNRGYYLGSNVSYNVKKMVENGYLENERSTHDRRSVRLRLSPKGLDLFTKVSDMFTRQIAALGESAITETDLKAVIKQLQVLEQFWTRQLNLATRRTTPFGTAAA
ncbi:MAG TPA: MarR family winged helix-turn-helix transcriptional regulator [Alphaproteobacteria bacterium]